MPTPLPSITTTQNQKQNKTRYHGLDGCLHEPRMCQMPLPTIEPCTQCLNSCQDEDLGTRLGCECLDLCGGMTSGHPVQGVTEYAPPPFVPWERWGDTNTFSNRVAIGRANRFRHRCLQIPLTQAPTLWLPQECKADSANGIVGDNPGCVYLDVCT